MWFFYLFYLFTVLEKSFFSLDIVDRIFYQTNEVRNLNFSLDYRNSEKLATDDPIYDNGEQLYGYTHKSLENIIPIRSHDKIKEYLSDIVDKNSCAYFITQENSSSELKEKCMNKHFCGILPKNAHISEETKNNRIYCAHINKSYIIIYSLGEPIVVEPNVVFQELFFEKEKKGILDCHGLTIDIRLINIHTQHGCLQDKLLNNIMSECNEKSHCEIIFSNVDKSSKCLTAHSFFVSIYYECKPNCNIKNENEICKATSTETKEVTCKYGYNMLNSDEGTCQKNTACLNEICSVNEYCNTTERSCICRDTILDNGNDKCEYDNVCDLLKCPKDASCEYSLDGKKAQCKCSDHKIFYNNKCYTPNELELAIQLELRKNNTIYKDHLYEGSALQMKHIFLKCEENYSIEVINAYATCYKVQFSDNKMKYMTEILKKECNGKMSCIYGNGVDHEDTTIYSMCNNSNIVFKYQYLCKADNQEENHSNKKKVEIFRSRFRSKLQCQGGEITINKALLKTGEGCDDLDLSDSLKKYCDGLSDCDIGLTHHFDTYCINDQYLFVTYECSDLCGKCTENSSCYGNKFQHRCFCNKPYISKNEGSVCEKPTSCDSVTCGVGQVCKDTNNKIFCECDQGYKNVDGSCIKDDGCDLLCPSNKLCTIEDDIKKCKCPEGYILEKGVCVCSKDEYIIDQDGNCIPKNKCKREEYKNICTNEGEECVYNKESEIIRCECKMHYIKNERGECIPKNYCLEHTCGRNEECRMVNFTPQCDCRENFKRESEGVCVHENFCLQNRGNCPIDSTCIYKEDGIHECRCNKHGYLAVDGSCVLEDKCSSHNICSENSLCVNVLNKQPLCICMFNYSKLGGKCVIKNPCLKENGGCPRNSICSMRNNKVTCECKEDYKKEGNLCVPEITENDKDSTFNCNNNVSAALGSCGIIEFNYKDNQIIWKINNTNESYIFDYEYPESGILKAHFKNKGDKSIVFLKKEDGNNIIFDDFHVDHERCMYENVFFYTSKENNEKTG
ncbi:Rh5 interacting protein, putative [Plasmodium relictum]|uniref:Rh5 interacting protein, putative n=1 Tax=Plasmodium relictum TaxID=85471 RepID=A0A1J1H8F6_PLARL|nr:Rh5 interacting protein, putative [Plasmodium relictum]CRG99720.1 Rh5 interacting protein, putative [Plasmodium relictum]